MSFVLSNVLLQMVRKNVGDKKRQKYSEDVLREAISRIKKHESGYRSLREASRSSGIPRTTLQDYLKRYPNAGRFSFC